LLRAEPVDDDALQVMVDATHGYPFLIQLVAAQAWNRHREADDISLTDASEGVQRARRRLGTLVHQPALRGVSDIGKSFLAAMAHDDGRSRMKDIQTRLGVDANYVSQYRLRLIDAELIEPAGHGYVRFTVPYLADYLREHAVTDAW
jgi:hypothetical protein